MAPSCPSCPAEAEGAGDGLDLGSEPTVAPPEPPPPPAGASSPPKAGRGSVMEAVRAPPPPVPHVVHRTAEAARAMLADKAGRGVTCGIDYETVGLDPRTGELRLVQVAEEGRPVDIVDVRACGGPEAVTDLLGRVTGGAHNALFELGWNRRHGVDNNLHCTKVAARLVEGGGDDKPVRGDDDSGGLGLGALARRHLDQV